MIIMMKDEVSEKSEDVKRVLEMAKTFPGIRTEIRTIQGASRTLIEVYLLGPTGTIPKENFEQIPGVEKAIRIREKYRIIGRHDEKSNDPGFDYQGLKFHQDSFHIFAGLCAVDKRENVESMFRALKEVGIVTTRAGAYKPRTSPYDFQGHGKTCLPYVFELAGKYGIKVISMEITHESHIDEIFAALRESGNATGVMLQIGTRNAQNFELLKLTGQQQELPILFKRGMGITLEESLNACEYLAAGGNQKIIFGLRGVKSLLGEPHRNMVDFAQVPVVKRLTVLPVCVDPSHSVGKKVRVQDGLYDIHHVTAQGVVAGANMVLVDFHPRPTEALCDGPQALTLDELAHFVQDVQIVRRAYEERKKLAAPFRQKSA